MTWEAQYRSGIYTFSDAQQQMAEASRDAYQAALKERGLGTITTEIEPAQPFYFAEEYHQQYLAKVPNGYCGLGGTGVSLPGWSGDLVARARLLTRGEFRCCLTGRSCRSRSYRTNRALCWLPF